MEPTNQEMTTLITDNNFINIIKSNKCFKTSTDPCIELFLTNKPKRFSFLKTFFTKMLPNKLRYRKYKLFDKIDFLKHVSNLPEKTNCTEWENQFLRVLKKNIEIKSN